MNLMFNLGYSPFYFRHAHPTVAKIVRVNHACEHAARMMACGQALLRGWERYNRKFLHVRIAFIHVLMNFIIDLIRYLISKKASL